VVLAYLPALRGGFVWDDDAYVTANRALRSLGGLWRIWFEPSSALSYYPLTFTSLWLDYQLWGARPFGYHLVNVLLHGLNAVLVWRLLERLHVPGARLAAALFALHPVHVESVAWITERKNVLSGAFYLGALLAWPGLASTGDEASNRRRYVVALALFAAALLAKTVTCTLPAAVLVIGWWRRGTLEWRDVRRTLPLFALGGLLAATTVWVERQHAAGIDWELSPVERVLIAGRALWFYVGKLLWPTSLTFSYPRWDIDDGVGWQYLFPLAALAVGIALLAGRHRLGRGPFAAMLFFVLTVAPALGFVDVFPFRYSFVADHFQYLASLGPITLAAAAVASMRVDVNLRRVVPVGVLAVLALLTWRQAGIYRDLETLWRDTLAKNPGSWMAHNNLGLLLADRGQFAAAEAHYRAAIGLQGEDAFARNNLGNLLARQGDYAAATREFAAVLESEPNNPEAHNNLGNALAMQGRLAEAMEHWAHAIRVRPLYAEPHNNLATALASQGRIDEAAQHLVEALRKDPDYADAHRNLGMLLSAQGRRPEAAHHLETALRLRPDDGAARAALEDLRTGATR
jgi:tetratricopeptide (TPR) repeat protein